MLKASAENKKILELIESSSFVVSLESESPVTPEERARIMWHSDGRNRFYDKPANVIVCEKGQSGYNGEHSLIDGILVCHFNDTIISSIEKGDYVNETPDIDYSVPNPIELKFVLNDEIKKMIEIAEKNFLEIKNSFDLKVLNYHNYSADLIKKFKCSPDAFLEMIFQLAYYKMYGINRPTSETASTSQFKDGRTETCRSVSKESVMFTQAMSNPNISDSAKLRAARKAIDKQVELANMATDGLGVDRHLLGLKKFLSHDEPIPQLFKDPMFKYSSTWYLATSQMSSEYFNGNGWSPYIKDGYGIE